MFKLGFIDFYLDEWHANNYPKMIHDASNGDMEVVYAYGLIDSPKGGRTTEQWCKEYGITRCMSIEELVEKSDGIIVLSPDNAEMHEGLSQLPLRSGKRCYIDKTFAPDVETAKRIFAVAEVSGTPCYSTSALRYADEYRNLDKKGITSIASWGPGSFETYLIHQVEPLTMLMRAPVEKVLIQPLDTTMTMTMLVAYKDGRTASVTTHPKGAKFMMNIAREENNEILTVESPFFQNFIAEMVDFFRTGDIKVPHEETLEVMRLRTAAMKAMAQPCQWIQA